MGYTRWSSSSWKKYATTTKTKSTAEIFTSHSINEDLNPKGVTMRESRDSDLNPQSTAIIVGCDVTGSMGRLADHLVRKGLGTLFEEILDRKPVPDPHLMVMGIGDALYDSAPIQVSQFEADLTIASWLEKIYIEKGGGGNSHESYDLPYYFAAYHTSIDCFEKRNKKGYLFTMGDELPPSATERRHVSNFLVEGGLQADVPFAEMIEAAQRMYHCYHLIVAEGSFARSRGVDKLRRAWADVMGQNAIVLEDHTKLAEVITSIIEVNEGRDKEEVVKSWSGDTSLVVSTAVGDLTPTGDFDGAMGVVKL